MLTYPYFHYGGEPVLANLHMISKLTRASISYGKSATVSRRFLADKILAQSVIL